MKVRVVTKKIKKITTDDEYYDAWKLVNELDGRAEALLQVHNGEIENALKASNKANRERNKLIDMMKNYSDKPHEKEDFENE